MRSHLHELFTNEIINSCSVAAMNREIAAQMSFSLNKLVYLVDKILIHKTVAIILPLSAADEGSGA